jgi:hypothetical protein
VTFLDSPAVRPTNVSVSSLRLDVDGELLAQVTAGQLDYTQWAFQLPLLAGEFDAGDHVLSLTAIGATGAVTEPLTLDFTTIDEQGTYVSGQFDFGSERFLEPIIEPLKFDFIPDCTPSGTLVLESMRIRVLGDDDMPVAVELSGNTFDGMMSMPITPAPQLDGWITFECPSSDVLSNPLTWGSYRIEAQARLAGISCFETPPVDLAPQPVDAQAITLERVMIDGQPACPECVQNVDCLPAADSICADGLCVPKGGS